jgi:hypothetical protein
MSAVPALSLAFDPPGDDPTRLVVRFNLGRGAVRRVFFQSDGRALSPNGEALLCLGLVPAMEIGADLVIGEPVDRDLLDNAARIQALLCSWYPGYRPIRIEAEPTSRRHPPARGAGVYFSGGIDSSYSLVEERHRLDALVTLIGADVDIGNTKQARQLRAIAAEAASRYGLEPIIVETDIRHVSDRMVGWVEYHGALLGAVRHLLADRLETQIIASSADESSWTRPWGSHPALDPLFGTPGARIEHHGLVHRFAKIDRIKDEPVLMRHLRVCDDYDDANCGACGECHFTQFSLAALDAFDRAPTFSKADLPRARVEVSGLGSRSDCVHLRDAAARLGRPPGLPARVDRAVRWFDLKTSMGRLIPMEDWARRFKRFKRRRRYCRAAGGAR